MEDAERRLIEMSNAIEDRKELKCKMKAIESSLEIEMEKSHELEKRLRLSVSSCEKVKTERNLLKGKVDSLTKEIARVCKGGLTLSKIENMLHDNRSMKTEISILKKQKAEALRGSEKLQSLCDSLMAAHNTEGLIAANTIHKKDEYERIITSLTENLEAKEMQISSLKQANQLLLEKGD